MENKPDINIVDVHGYGPTFGAMAVHVETATHPDFTAAVLPGDGQQLRRSGDLETGGGMRE